MTLTIPKDSAWCSYPILCQKSICRTLRDETHYVCFAPSHTTLSMLGHRRALSPFNLAIVLLLFYTTRLHYLDLMYRQLFQTTDVRALFIQNLMPISCLPVAEKDNPPRLLQTSNAGAPGTPDLFSKSSNHPDQTC